MFKMAMRKDAERILGWKSAEKDSAMKSLSRLTTSTSLAFPGEEQLPTTSAKFECLVHILIYVHKADFCGLTFVNQRATVVALSQLLSVHPKTQGMFKYGTFVGMSSNVHKKTELGDLLNPKMHQTTLEGFRKGTVNLIIATNALEEGIDLSACNTVICFDEPPNLKSFIQRRGRARKEMSNFYVLLAHNRNAVEVQRWHDLEQEMNEAYQRDREIVDKVGASESIHEQDYESFSIESTGALLTMDAALGHLNHFCATLPRQPYINLEPTFSFEESDAAKQIRAVVYLPSCIAPALRSTRGIRTWHSERMATKDAAFQAYTSLYRAGLVNDHLLPFHPKHLETFKERPPFLSVPDQCNPWLNIAALWQPAHKLYHRVISIKRPGSSEFEIGLILPVCTRLSPDFPLYIDSGTTYTVSMHEHLADNFEALKDLSICREISRVILQSIYRETMVGVANDFVVPFVPILRGENLKCWLSSCYGSFPASKLDCSSTSTERIGLLRDKNQPNSAFISCCRYKNNRDAKLHPGSSERIDQTRIPATPLTGRRNFLSPAPHNKGLATAKGSDYYYHASNHMWLPKDCHMVDLLPFDFAQFALLVPSIMYRIEAGLVAEQLCTRMCPLVRFGQLDLVIDSICAPSINLQTKRGQLEFLGSSVLKIIVARQLSVNHTNWHEGHLSQQKDLIVSSNRLIEAALRVNLDGFVLTKNFNSHMWKPLYISETRENYHRGERLIPVKLLAGTIEALVAAAFLDNDLCNAANCARFFLPEVKEWSWTALHDGTYFLSRPRYNKCPPCLTNLELTLDYKFHDKSLLIEAMTHPSCDWSISTCTYRRLAFLGDAVLEMFVTKYLTREAQFLTLDKIHLCKAASTNAKFLAFLCMGSTPDVTVISSSDNVNGKLSNTNNHAELRPWMFLRYSNDAVTVGRDKSLRRHATYVESIQSAFSDGSMYPWRDLARVAADSLFSDVIQSLFGAIYIDSKGDLMQCESLAGRLGVITHLRHFIELEIDLRHPKSRLVELASRQKIEYIHGEAANNQRAHGCVIEINDYEVARMYGEWSKECREIMAAELAIEKQDTWLSKAEETGSRR